MLLKLPGVSHVSSVVHESKLIAVATARADKGFRLLYTVRQDGFEDKALDGSGWEAWEALALPNEPDDNSVVEAEKQTLTRSDPPENYLLRSRYRTATLTADAPVQLVSHDGHLYVFRQSTEGRLLADRYVLDGMNNRLVRKIEVRFKRSRERLRPQQPARITAGGKQEQMDTPDFTDMLGSPFFEPSTELFPDLLVVSGGHFAVTVVETSEKDSWRWHLFALDGGRVNSVSLRAGDEQAFDVGDILVQSPDGDGNGSGYARLPGVVHRSLRLRDAAGKGLAIDALAVSAYDVQSESETTDGRQWLREQSRLMLALGAGKDIAALCFGIAANGLLARIETPVEESLRENPQEIGLPPDLLDSVRALASTPVAAGAIRELQRAPDGPGTDQLLVHGEGDVDRLDIGDTVRLSCETRHDGMYVAGRADDDTFDIRPPAAYIGRWEKRQDAPSGLTFDGMVVGYGLNEDGSMTVRAPGHGLSSGDLVQLTGVGGLTGEFPVIVRDGSRFVLERRWLGGIAVNVQSAMRHRRGLCFDGRNDRLRADLETANLGTGGITVELWVRPAEAARGELLQLNTSSGDSVRLQLADGMLQVATAPPAKLAAGQWQHVALSCRQSASMRGRTALDFDGSTTAVDLGGVQVAASGFGFAAWVRFDQLVENARIFDFGESGSESLRIFLTVISVTDNPIFVLVVCNQAGGRSMLQAPALAAERRWMHLAVSVDAKGNATLHRDGTALKTQLLNAAPPGLRRVSRIGGPLSDGKHFDGRMADVVLWRKAFDTATLEQIMRGPSYDADIIGWWPLSDAQGAFVPGFWCTAAASSRARLTGTTANGEVLRLELSIDGRFVACTLADGPAAPIRELYIAGSGNGEALAGELSDVRLWSRARKVYEIADAMHAAPEFDVEGLCAHWALRGLARGMPSADGAVGDIVRDAGPLGLHAVASGDPFLAPARLERQMAAGLADRFGSDELVAVIEGGLYEESFEFRLSPAASADIDDPFTADVWGKAGRNSDARVAIEPTSLQFPKSLKTDEPGWRRCTVRVVIPRDVRLLRGFGIANLSAGWSSMELRRHRLRLLSDTITLSTAEESVALSAAALAAEGQHQALRKVHDLERKLRMLSSQRRSVKSRLGLLQNLTVKAAQRSVLKSVVDSLRSAADSAKDAHQRQLNGPWNYWCRIVAEHSQLSLNVRGATQKQGEKIIQWTQSGTNQQWRLESSSVQGEYHLHVEHSNKVLCFDPAYTWGTDWPLLQGDLVHASTQRWKLTPVGSDSVNGPFYLMNAWEGAPGRCASVRGGSTASSEHVDLSPLASKPYQQFRFKKVEVGGESRLVPGGQEAIDKAKLRLDEAEAAWKARNEKLVELDAQIDIPELERAAEEIALDQLEKSLETERNATSVVLEEERTAAIGLKAPPTIGMRLLDSVDGAAGLDVHAVLLTGNERAPGSRLHAMESCLGEVVVSYSDARGSLRQARFDNCHDASGIGERWMPHPMPTAARVKSGEGASGKPSMSQAMPDELWIGADDSLTIEFRACSDPERLDGQARPVLSGGGALTLGIELPDASGQLVWTAGSGESPDRLIAPAADELMAGGWTQWAFVKDCEKGVMRIYANGRLLAENAVDDKQFVTRRQQRIGGINSVRLELGRYGLIADLRIWNEALDPQEIETHCVQPPSPCAPGLHAWYALNRLHGTAEMLKRTPTLPADMIEWAPDTSGVLPALGAPQWISSGTSFAEATSGGGDTVFVHARAGFTCEGWVRLQLNGAIAGAEARVLTLNARAGDTVTEEYALLLIAIDAAAGAGVPAKLPKRGPPLLRCKLEFRYRSGTGSQCSHSSKADLPLLDGKWHHVAVAVQPLTVQLFLDGRELKPPLSFVASSPRATRASAPPSVQKKTLGSSVGGGEITGSLRSVRLWDSVLNQEQLRASMHRGYHSGVGGLLGSWLDPEEGEPCAASLSEAAWTRASRDGQRSAVMTRGLLLPHPDGVLVLDRSRIEELDLRWIGNAQIKPTLLGYIEGPPPIPSENLTEEDDYNDATSVELVQSSDMELSWSRDVDRSIGSEVDLLAGYKSASSAGAIAIQTSTEEVKSGVGARGSYNRHWLASSTVAAQSSLASTERLSLRGNRESDPAFAHIGCRFIPKNIGYALVVSGLSDLFVSRLKRSGRMVSYITLPVADMPLDVNTITFLINPAYTMAGSLDGMTGSQPTSQRFFRHVPEMRAQYGSTYPASYLRLKEAYALKDAIDRQDKRHQAYFENFNASSPTEAALYRQLDKADDNQDPAAALAPPGEGEAAGEMQRLDKAIRDVSAEINRLDALPDRSGAQAQDLINARLKKADLEKQRDAAVARQHESSRKRSEEKSAQIQERFSDASAQAHAMSGFERWQTRMEDLQVRAGKRNIVNTYVWDGDGGFHAEEQQFASSIEHSIGGSIDMSMAVGGQVHMALAKAMVELTAYGTAGMTQTLNKTQASSKGFELHVDLSGVESRGITDYRDRPLMPGEKVDRYRFMSFYLEGSTRHWHDFYTQVVDPEWLASNDEEARALREARLAAPNKAWRVLHRVTYVERPALMGFGRDLRPAGGGDPEPDLRSIVKAETASLRTDVAALRTQIGQILARLPGGN